MKTIDLTGRVVEEGKTLVTVKMVIGVFYEGRDLLPNETYALPDWFARQLIQQHRAAPVIEGELLKRGSRR